MWPSFRVTGNSSVPKKICKMTQLKISSRLKYFIDWDSGSQWFWLYLNCIQTTVFLSKDSDNIVHATWEWQTISQCKPNWALENIAQYFQYGRPFHLPKVRMNFSLSLISIFCSSRRPCNRFSLRIRGEIWAKPKQHQQILYECNLFLWGDWWRILTAHNSKSKTPRDQTSVLGPEGRGASSWEESLGWKEPWAITSGARYDGYLGRWSQSRQAHHSVSL